MTAHALNTPAVSAQDAIRHALSHATIPTTRPQPLTIVAFHPSDQSGRRSRVKDWRRFLLGDGGGAPFSRASLWGMLPARGRISALFMLAQEADHEVALALDHSFTLAAGSGCRRRASTGLPRQTGADHHALGARRFSRCAAADFRGQPVASLGPAGRRAQSPGRRWCAGGANCCGLALRWLHPLHAG